MAERTAETLTDRLERLVEIRGIFLRDREENFAHERLLASLDSWIEDLDIEISEEEQ